MRATQWGSLQTETALANVTEFVDRYRLIGRATFALIGHY